MSKCDLSIELEDPDRIYQPGEAVSGFVNVSAEEQVRCQQLTVKLQWRTHGRGNRSEGPTQTVNVFSGEWPAGTRTRYPFELEAPAGPSTYHGNLVNVDHYLSAHADLAWAMDPKAETEILLRAKEATGYFHGPSHALEANRERTTEIAGMVGSVVAAGCFGVPGVAMLVGGLAMVVYWMAGRQPEGMGAGITLVIFGAVFTAVGFGVAFLAQKKRVAARKLGTPAVQVSPRVVRPGDRVAVDVTLRPNATVSLSAAKVTLHGREVAVSGSGTNQTTHTHSLHRESVGLNAPSRIQGGHDATFKVEVRVPEGAVPTFSASSNRVVWLVEVTIGIAGWPDWEAEFPLTVTP